MEDSYDLQRFVDAQDRVFEQVRQELQDGSKRSHWMWFVFPQIAGLGFSQMAARYAISSLAEATELAKGAPFLQNHPRGRVLVKPILQQG